MSTSTTKPDAAVVVDPYSSGRYLLYDLKDRDIPIICIRSSLNLGKFFLDAYTANKEYYATTVDFQDNLEQLLSELNNLPYNIIAVFPGCEPGVTLAEQLSEALKLPTANGTELLQSRKDKGEMQEQLRRCGVPAAKQFISGDVEELCEWARNNNEWPLVAKPASSSGSDGVYFLHSEEELRAAHAEKVGTMDPNGNVVNVLVLQEFLAGTEYIVDTVSHGGRHLCVAIWVYAKRRGLPWNPTAILCERDSLLPPDGEIQDTLTSYVFSVLDAVGLKYGPCHTEVMFTARGPILVEVNCRLHGLQGPQLIALGTGTSKATYAVDALACGAKLFNEHYKEGPQRFLYPVQKHVVQLVLICGTQGFLTRGIANSVYALKLPSVYKVLPAYQKGKIIVPSCDLNTAAGYALMVHESAEQIEEDIATIRRAEEDGTLYQVSCEAPVCTPQMSPSQSPALTPADTPAIQPKHSPIPIAGVMGTSLNRGSQPSDGVGLSPFVMPSLHQGTPGSLPTPGTSAPEMLSAGMFQRASHSYGSMSSFNASDASVPSPMLHSMERAEEVWAAVNGFTLTDENEEDVPSLNEEEM